MADIGNVQMYNEYHEDQKYKYIVDVEIKAYRSIEVVSNSVEEAKILAEDEFTRDPWIDELREWEAISVMNSDTNTTLWLKKGD